MHCTFVNLLLVAIVCVLSAQTCAAKAHTSLRENLLQHVHPQTEAALNELSTPASAKEWCDMVRNGAKAARVGWDSHFALAVIRAEIRHAHDTGRAGNPGKEPEVEATQRYCERAAALPAHMQSIVSGTLRVHHATSERRIQSFTDSIAGTARAAQQARERLRTKLHHKAQQTNSRVVLTHVDQLKKEQMMHLDKQLKAEYNHLNRVLLARRPKQA